MLSAKFPMKAMMVIFCMSLSILLNCIMNRSSSDKFSRGFLSRSYSRSTFTSFSVGKNLIRHSTKSTGSVFKSNLKTDVDMSVRERKPTLSTTPPSGPAHEPPSQFLRVGLGRCPLGAHSSLCLKNLLVFPESLDFTTTIHVVFRLLYNSKLLEINSK